MFPTHLETKAHKKGMQALAETLQMIQPTKEDERAWAELFPERSSGGATAAGPVLASDRLAAMPRSA